MDAKAREELVERTADIIFASGFTQNMANARGVARAALAVIEPWLREHYARIAEDAIVFPTNGREPTDAETWIGAAVGNAIRGGSNG